MNRMSIGITGRGLATSLGCDVVTACAAARAGIVGSTSLEFELTSPTGDLERAVGHPARGLTEGFEGYARLLRLAQLAFGDLRRQASASLWRSPSYTGFYLSLPDPLRVHSGIARLSDEARSARAEEAERARENVEPAEEIAQRLLRACARACSWPTEPSLRFHTISGHAGVVQAIASAMVDLIHGRVSSAIVGAVDSLLDHDTLLWLMETGRLKSLGAPVGLQPGEASVFLVLEPVDAATTKGTSPLAIVEDVQLGTEERHLLSGEAPLGVGLARVLGELMRRENNAGPTFCITDQNGEGYRAMEWGYAAQRLSAASPSGFSPQVWYTAASFGDTGAASAALSLCLATSAFQRGYAPSTSAMITSSSDGPARGAVVLRAPSR